MSHLIRTSFSSLSWTFCKSIQPFNFNLILALLNEDDSRDLFSFIFFCQAPYPPRWPLFSFNSFHLWIRHILVLFERNFTITGLGLIGLCSLALLNSMNKLYLFCLDIFVEMLLCKIDQSFYSWCYMKTVRTWLLIQTNLKFRLHRFSYSTFVSLTV